MIRAFTVLASVLGRGEWGRAMAVELEQVSGGRARRRFASGCVRALVASLPAPALTAFGAGLLSLALVAVALLRYPGVVSGVGTWLALGLFACVVVAYVVAAAGLATRLLDAQLLAVAVAAAAAIACSWFGVGLSAAVEVPEGVSVALLALGPAVAIANAAWATRHSGSPGTGMRCVGLASLLGGFALFLLWTGQTVAFAGRPYDSGLRADFRSSGARDLATYAVNDNLGSAMVLLLLVPLVSLTAGLAGAVIATRRLRAGSR